MSSVTEYLHTIQTLSRSSRLHVITLIFGFLPMFFQSPDNLHHLHKQFGNRRSLNQHIIFPALLHMCIVYEPCFQTHNVVYLGGEGRINDLRRTPPRRTSLQCSEAPSCCSPSHAHATPAIANPIRTSLSIVYHFLQTITFLNSI